MLTRQDLDVLQKKEKTRKRKEAHATHRKRNRGSAPSFSEVATFKAALGVQPLPPVAPLHIRFILPKPTVNMLISWHDRTIKGWFQSVEQWKTMTWFTKAEGDRIKEQLRHAVFQNLRVRWQLRKWILRHRLAESHRRNTDLTDLCTTLEIPEKARVTIYDLPNHKAYYFHYQTIQKLICNSLLFQQYGIANPLYPKNPYTNLPWSHAQMISIHQQIWERTGYHGRLPNNYIIEFQRKAFCTQTFRKKNLRHLAIAAAESFFQKKYDADVQEIYLETLDDMYNDYFELRRSLFGRNTVVDLIIHDALPNEIQQKWDELVVSFWIYQNYRLLRDPYTKFDDLLDQVRKLHSITYQHDLASNRGLLIFVAATPIPPTLPLNLLHSP